MEKFILTKMIEEEPMTTGEAILNPQFRKYM